MGAVLPAILLPSATSPQPASLLDETLFSKRHTAPSVALSKAAQTRMDTELWQYSVSVGGVPGKEPSDAPADVPPNAEDIPAEAPADAPVEDDGVPSLGAVMGNGKTSTDDDPRDWRLRL